MSYRASDPAGEQYNLLRTQTEIVESLAHSLAYERLLTDNMAERTAVMSCDNSIVPSSLLPPEIGFTGLVSVNDFKCGLDETRDEDGASWLFTATMDIGENRWEMAANDGGTVLVGTDPDGKATAYQLPVQSAQRFLGSLAVTFLNSGEGGIQLEGILGRLDDGPAAAIDSIMHAIGASNGRYRSEITAKLPHDESRALVAKLIETETPTNNGVNVLLRMGWLLADDIVTETTSFQREALRKAAMSDIEEDDSPISRLIPKNIETRFASRRPTETQPEEMSVHEDLDTSELLGEDPDPTITFDSRADLLLYMMANSSIMTVLSGHLKDYAEYDHSLWWI